MEEWKKYKYTELAEIIGGGTPKTSVKEYWDGDIPWLSVKDFGNGNKYVYSTEKTITTSGLNNSSTKLLKKHDIIISARGTVGEMAMIPFAMAFNQSCFGLRAKEVIDSDYLYYLTKTKIRELQNNSHGCVFDTITKNTFDNILCFIPSKDLQIYIASILSSLDDKIELNRRINDNLEQQAQALYKSWFVNFEPFRGGKFVDSELGMIPEDWKVGTLLDIANIKMGQSPSGSSFNENGDGIIFYQGRTEFGKRFPSIRLYTTEPTRYAVPNSVLLSVRAPVGDINITTKSCCIGRGIASLYSRDYYSSFLFYTLKTLKPMFDRFNGEGTVFGSINKKALEEMKILLPTECILLKFETIVNPLDSHIQELSEEVLVLSNYRDNLLPRLMSGELKINEMNS
jgi:type I restriction enzyme, S subunit